MKKIVLLILLVSVIVTKSVLAIPPIPEIPPFPAIISNGHIYHVDRDHPNADDVRNDPLHHGDSAEYPWQTIQYAAERLHAGDTLIVHESSIPYDSWIDIGGGGSGESNNWITIMGADNENTVLQNARVNVDTGSAYILFKNIDIRGTNWMIMDFEANSHHIVIENVEIDCQSSTTNYTGIWVGSGVNNVWFKNMDIHHCGYVKTDPTDCSGICMNDVSGTAVNDITFLNVTLRDNKGDGISSGSSTGTADSVYFDGCTANNNTGDGFDIAAKTRAVFKNTVSKNNGPDQGVGFKSWSKDTWLVNSIAYNNVWEAIQYKPNWDDSNLYVLNSTFVGDNKTHYGGEIRNAIGNPYFGINNVYLYNNIFHAVNTKAVVFENIGRQTLAGEDNNYYFSANNPSLPNSGETIAFQLYDNGNEVASYTFSDMDNSTGYSRWYVDRNQGEHDIGRVRDIDGLPNPGFVDVVNADFHLTNDSLAIDAGTNVGISEDLEGKPVFNGIRDIGAYEACTDNDNDGYAAEGGACGPVDCDDTNAAIHPGATEACNSVDDNCDGQVDNITYYPDSDGDGYGRFNNGITGTCITPPGCVPNNLDCDDNNAPVNPGAIEVCGNSTDENCDGIIAMCNPSDWYNDGIGGQWQYRELISISQGMTTANLNNFPVLIKITDPGNSVFTKAKTNGDDIVFTNSSGLKLDHEIEKFDPETRNLVAWVKLDLSSSGNAIYMYYGNEDINLPSQQNKEGVWDTNYMMVQHLSETTGQHMDSTSNDNDSDFINVGSQGQTIISIIGGSDEFNIDANDNDGVNDYINIPDKGLNSSLDLSGNGPLTISAWIYAEGPGDGADFQSGIVFKQGNYAMRMDGVNCTNTGDYTVVAPNTCGVSTPNNISRNAWSYVTYVYDTADNKQDNKLFVNGNLITLVQNMGFNRTDSPYDLNIGMWSSGRSFDGYIDEVRISNTARSAVWVQAEYNNQNNHDTYIHVALQEIFCTDSDNDGYASEGGACGAVDCNDNNAAINPSASDANCNGVDENCSGTPDEGYVSTPTSCGVGECVRTGELTCQNGQQVNTCSPGTPQTEICDGLDNNCDGSTDNGLTAPLNDLQAGVCSGSIKTCNGTGGWVNNYNGIANYEATEITCDVLDNDCDGQIDEGVKNTYYRDADGDGYGNPAVTMQVCTQPSGYVTDNKDCDDSNAAINPVAAEICDNVDNNCNGAADENLTRATTCGVGACSGNTGTETCSAGIWGNNTCNPYAGATPEICDNIDNNCNGQVDDATNLVTPVAGPNGSISPSTTQSVNCSGTASFTITPNTGYHIDSVSGCNGSLLDSTYTTGQITAACTVTATFAINTYTITASAGVNGTISPSGTVTVNYGNSQIFTITPNIGYHVADVLVDGSSAGAVTSYPFNNVMANHTINASFAVNRYTLTVTKAGTGSGTVTSAPGGINCGASCSATYDYATSVTLTAAPNSDSLFAGWSGGGCSGAGTCTIIMNGNNTAPATFTPYITVTAPNGGESWKRGTQKTITWAYAGNPGANVKIELYKGDVFNRSISSSTPIANSPFNWDIPNGQSPGTDYTIRITSTTNSNATDTSNGYFSITK